MSLDDSNDLSAHFDKAIALAREIGEPELAEMIEAGRQVCTRGGRLLVEKGAGALPFLYLSLQMALAVTTLLATGIESALNKTD